MNSKYITHLSFWLMAVLVLCAGVFGQGTYRSLRICIINPPYYSDIDTIFMNPTDTAPPQLCVRAQRLDDTTVWEFVTAEWSSDSNPVWRPYPPAIRGSGWIYARLNDSGHVLFDSVYVMIPTLTYDSLRIVRFISSSFVKIYQLNGTMPNSITLYVEGHRGADNIWVMMSGNWSLSSSLLGKTSPTLPPTNSNYWTFAPIDTGTGTITVSIAGGPSATLNPVVFTAGLPNLIAIYPQAGIPEAPNNPWPADPAVADTAVVDSPYNLLYAKLFYMTPTGKVIWLRQYEDSVQLAQQFSWTISFYPSDTISAITPNHITLKSSSGNRLIRVTANWNTLAYSILVLMIPNQPNSIMENRDLNLRRNNWSVSSAYGRIFVHFPDNAAYDIRVFSLAGYCIVSRLASACDVSFRLPTGVYIVSVGQAGSRQETRKRVVAIGR